VASFHSLVRRMVDRTGRWTWHLFSYKGNLKKDGYVEFLKGKGLKEALKRMQFCPFVMSTFCGLGVQARRLAMFISSKQADRWCVPEKKEYLQKTEI
jgi:hypothetical protein